MTRCVGWVAMGLLAAGVALGGPKAPDPIRLLAKANNAFACELHRQLPANGNVVCSPYGVMAVLSMADAGAAGNTKAELEKAMHVEAIAAVLARTNSECLGVFTNSSRLQGCRLEIANGLWLQRGTSVLAPFAATMKNDYGGGFAELDMRGNPAAAAKAINLWATKTTHGRVLEIAQPGDFNANSRLVLTNAVYFEGKWAKAFPRKDTREEPFVTDAGAKVKVPMMSQVETFRYMGNKQVQFIQLPYRGGNMAMFVLLPREVDGLPAIERQLSPELLNGWLQQMKETGVSLQLPRWEFDSTLPLIAPLQQLGVKDAFEFDAADFSAMSSAKTYVGVVRQKAMVKVDEEGTVAAAVTGLQDYDFDVPAAPPVVFRADHPFLFLICHLKTGHILFMGRVANPAVE